MTKRKVGRPRSSDRQKLNLLLPTSVIENMKAIALSKGFITQIGRHKGEPNISGWLINEFKGKE